MTQHETRDRRRLRQRLEGDQGNFPNTEDIDLTKTCWEDLAYFDALAAQARKGKTRRQVRR